MCSENHSNIFLAQIFKKSFKKLNKYHTVLSKPYQHYLSLISVLRLRTQRERIILRWTPPQDQLYCPDSGCLNKWEKTFSSSFNILENLSLKIHVQIVSSSSSCSIYCRLWDSIMENSYFVLPGTIKTDGWNSGAPHKGCFLFLYDLIRLLCPHGPSRAQLRVVFPKLLIS